MGAAERQAEYITRSIGVQNLPHSKEGRLEIGGTVGEQWEDGEL